MAKYIEREAILREIERRERLMVGDKTISVDALKRFILDRPTADAEVVVRCKDCKHYRYRVYSGRYMCARNAALLDGHEVGLCVTEKDDFCSYGERKGR